MLTTCFHFAIEKLQEVIESRKLDLYFLSSLLWTFALSTVSFGVLYYGLNRIDGKHFAGAESAGILDFVGFSFTILMTSGISSITPLSGEAQFLTYTQLFVSLLLIVLLVFIILTSIREKYKKDLDDLVNELGNANEQSRQYIEQNYELTLEAMEKLLVRKNEQMMKLLLGVRYGKSKAEHIIEKVKVEPNEANNTGQPQVE